MSDMRLRELERTAASGDPEAVQRLRRLQARSGDALDAAARRFAGVLTPAGALWVAGGKGFSYSAITALSTILTEAGHFADEARQYASDRALWRRVVELCRERARREWDPIRAIAVLGNRERIRAALRIERMPPGTAAEERRQRQAWVELLARNPHYADTDVLDRSWRPPKAEPHPMGWEHLLPVRYASTPRP